MNQLRAVSELMDGPREHTVVYVATYLREQSVLRDILHMKHSWDMSPPLRVGLRPQLHRMVGGKFEEGPGGRYL